METHLLRAPGTYTPLGPLDGLFGEAFGPTLIPLGTCASLSSLGGVMLSRLVALEGVETSLRVALDVLIISSLAILPARALLPPKRLSNPGGATLWLLISPTCEEHN